MDKKQTKEIQDMMNITLSLMNCSKDKCMIQKNEILKNMDIVKKYAKLNYITDKNEITKIVNQLGKNNIVFEYEKCVFNNCKKILKNLINMLQLFVVTNLPETDKKYKKITTLLNKLSIIINKKEYTIKDNNEFIKNNILLMNEMK